MGMRLFGSNSGGSCYQTKENSIPDTNPNPYNFKIRRISKIEEYLIVYINYMDCVNYEGNKILVFKDISISEIKQSSFIDPHFCKGEHISPIARFEPTKRGYKMAYIMCKGMINHTSKEEKMIKKLILLCLNLKDITHIVMMKI